MKIKNFANKAKNRLTGRTKYGERIKEHYLRMQRAAALNPAGHYHEWLQVFHRICSPQLYCEIGVQYGKTLALKNKESMGIGIDPAFNVRYPISNVTLYKMASDQFFYHKHLANENLPKFDLCFIDGMHEYKQVLRDIVNCALNSRSHAILLIHDVMPPDQQSATADRKTTLWLGDVYKVIPFLVDYFPGINMTFIHTAPTGMLALSNIDSIANNPLVSDILGGGGESTKEFDQLTVNGMKAYLPKVQKIIDNPCSVAAIEKHVIEIRGI